MPDEWLKEFETSEAHRRLKLLEADNDLLDRIMWAGYRGPDYDLLEDRLIGYGLQVLRAWIRTGRIFAECAKRGHRLPRPDLSWNPDSADELANETLVVAVRRFRDDVLIPRVWKPSGGASLKTYFIGQCLLRFPNLYRRWLKENGLAGNDPLTDRRGREVQRITDRWNHPPTRSGDPEANLGPMVLIGLAADPKGREILQYIAEGYQHEEIAELTGLSVSAVKSRLHRIRGANRRGPTQGEST
jgi:DNA-directed RNA polymerase specialized sigma24 family protein